MSTTLLLEPAAWDLTLDASNNIAVAQREGTDPIGLAQDAASAIRLFRGELWFDTTQGIPYFARILGHAPPPALVKAYFVAAARSVPGVAKAVCFISSILGRRLGGQVQVTGDDGNTATTGF